MMIDTCLFTVALHQARQYSQKSDLALVGRTPIRPSGQSGQQLRAVAMMGV